MSNSTSADDRSTGLDEQSITEIAAEITQDDLPKTTPEQRQRLSQLGWERHCIFGAGRIAFKKDDTILKIAREDRNAKLNEQEVSVWSQHKSEDNILFAPVKNHGPNYSWLTMPYCKPGGEESDYEAKLEESHWDYVEVDFSNIGIYTKNDNEYLVAFDYHSAQPQEEI